MATDNKIEACYLEQARNLYNRIKPEQRTPKGVPLQNAASLFSIIELDSKYFKQSGAIYLKKVDADGNGAISVEELATVLQRADKESFKDSRYPLDIQAKNDQIADKWEIQEDFNKYGGVPYLLTEAKAQTPKLLPKIENRLKMGDFTVTGEKSEDDSNLFKENVNGVFYTKAIRRATLRYDILAQQAPAMKKAFLSSLADKQVPFYDMEIDENTNNIVFNTRQLDDKATPFPKVEMFIREDGTSLGAMPGPKESESIRDIIPGITSRPVIGRVYKDPEAEAAAKKVCEDVITETNLQYVNKSILEALDNPQKFEALVKKFEKPMQKAYGVNTSMVLTKENEDFAGQYHNHQIQINHKGILEYKKELEKTGVSKDKIREFFTHKFFIILTHEYWHAKSDDLGRRELQGDNAENDYISYEDSIRVFGDASRFSEQPSEKSSFLVNSIVDKHIRQLRKQKSR